MGRTPVYLSDFFLKLEPGKKLLPEEGLGIAGFMSNVTFIKSRNNRAGQTAELVYDQNRGFDNILSNFNLLKEEKEIGGAGRSFCLNDVPDVKFAQKNFKQKLVESKEMRKCYKKKLKEILETYIYDDKEDEVAQTDKTINDLLSLDDNDNENEEENKTDIIKKKKKIKKSKKK